MFKLKRLEITGFKSFADHTELVFTTDGITAIVGPNGCGKSNLSEAMAWVLGEQRVKNLRGGEMKDVIFQGSRNRPPSGMAEVVLHLVRDETTFGELPELDDIDSTLEEIDTQSEAVSEISLLDAGIEGDAQQQETAQISESAVDGTEDQTENPTEDQPGDNESSKILARARTKRHWRPSRVGLEFAPGETVSVTRRLYRSGESEYLLNNRACRLRDVQDLFSGTGLSGAHYAIIEQGRIGQILSAKPMDRRILVEEAAGITKFRVRQRAAEARLDAARSNLRRVSDIVSEIERQTGALRRQAAKARRYRLQREELRDLLRRLYTADERALAAQLEDLHVRLNETKVEEESLTRALEAGEAAARHATGYARQCEEELAEARRLASAAALLLDRRERERVYQQDQVATLDKRISNIAAESEAIQARLAIVEAEYLTLTEQDRQLRGESEETQRQLAIAEAAYTQRLAETEQAEEKIEKTRAELLTHTAVAERLMEIGRQLEAALERLSLQSEGLTVEGERAKAAHSVAMKAAEVLDAEMAVERLRVEELVAEREEVVRAVADARSLAAAAAAAHTGAREKSARVRHRLDTLIELDAQRSLYSEAVQRLFANNDEERPRDFHFIGTLADLLQVEPQWERAVESVLGRFLQSVVVPTPDDAARAAHWLKSNAAGSATFLVAGLHGGSIDEMATVFGGAGNDSAAAKQTGDLKIGDVLGAPSAIRIVLSRTLDREMGAVITDNLDFAVAESLRTGLMYVTNEGEWVSSGQLIGAGSFAAVGGAGGEASPGLLAFKREMRELEARAVELDRDAEEAEQIAAAERVRLSELEDSVVLLNEVIGREEREAVTRELRANGLAQEIERTERHLRVVAGESARLAEEQRVLDERRRATLLEAEKAEAARREVARQVAQATESLAGARRISEYDNEKLSEQRALAAAAAERRRATAADLKRIETEANELQSRLERYALEADEAESAGLRLRHSIEDIDETAERAQTERIAREEEIERSAAELTLARERADQLSLGVTDLNRRAATARDMRSQLEVQRAEIGARRTFLHEACLAELGQTLGELLTVQPQEEDFDLHKARAGAEELRARIESFGAVNMMALEELAEAEERLQFLTTQRQDITDGINATEEALREIKRRSRDRFRHAFEVINRNFGELFGELFGGGRGEMSLIDSDDVLESGIDIIAQPPGKRLQNVLLLSGGEKAMAALSLVLAIFRYRPSPFCLLDEVDAPLDEANIGRFTGKVFEMSTQTQFLVITHNKKTMEVARALYGVTMEEAGVSKLVSVEI